MKRIFQTLIALFGEKHPAAQVLDALRHEFEQEDAAFEERQRQQRLHHQQLRQEAAQRRARILRHPRTHRSQHR